MTEAAEVQVKLTLDDAASKVADTIKGKFDSLGKVTAKIRDEFLSVAKGALSTAIGVNLAPGLQSIVASFQGMVDNAINVQGRMRAVASYFVAGSDMAWSSAMDMSSKIDEQLYRSSIAIGQNIDDARKAFQYLAKASDGTTDSLNKAVAQTEKLLMFADVTGESVGDIASEWSMMERGIVRNRGNLFKMLFHTGIFGENMKEASTYWGKLTDEQRTKKMAEAMGTITDRFASAPQTMGSVIAGLQNIKQRLIDVVGMNIIGVLTSKFDNVLKSLESKRPQLEALASRFGQFLGKHIEEALAWGGEKLAWLEKNWDEVVKAAENGAKAILKAVKFIVDNKELILMAYGLNVMAPSIQVALAAAPALKGMMVGLKAVSFTSLPAFTASLGTSTAALGAMALKLGAMAAAVGAAYLAFDQYRKLQAEGGAGSAWQEMRYDTSKFSQGDVKATEEAMQRALQAGLVDDLAKMLTEKQERLAVTKEKLGMQFGAKAPEHYEAAGVSAMEGLLSKFAKDLPHAGQMMYADAITNQEEFLKVYNNAVNHGDQALANYVANFAARNVLVGSELLKSGDLIAGGFAAFAQRLGDATRALIDSISPEDLPTEKEVAARGATVNMNGGQTFHIKQDFREADPDRIALYMRKDLVRAATSRTRSRTRTPFGA